MTNILVCDDDREIVDAIEICLMQEGFGIIKAYDGEEAIEQLKKNDVKLLIIDIMMPKLDGIRATMKIREYSSIPILFLSAKSEDSDKILGLNIGADDYITKPFNILEVKARIKAVLRRVSTEQEVITDGPLIKYGQFHLDTDSRRLMISDKEIFLTAKEFDLLELLVRNAEKVFSREQLLNMVWGADYPGDVRTVDVHVRRLRAKIEPVPSEPRYVHTKWGSGYYFHSA